MARWLKRADLRNEKGNLHATATLQPRLARWFEAGLIEESVAGTVCVHPMLRHLLLGHLEEQGELARLAAVVRSAEPLHVHYAYGTASQTLRRELALALHLGMSAELERALQQHRPGRDEPKGELFVEAFGLAAPSAGLKRLGYERAALYLRRAFELAADGLSPLDPQLFAFVHEAAEQIPSPVLAAAALYLALRNERQAALAVLQGREDAECASARSVLALTSGAFDEARAQAELALTRALTRKSLRLKGLSGALWPWVVLAVISDPTPRHALELARAQLVIATRRDPRRRALCNVLAGFEGLLNGTGDGATFSWERAPVDQAFVTWTDLMLCVLLRRFSSEAVSPGTGSRRRASCRSTRRSS